MEIFILLLIFVFLIINVVLAIGISLILIKIFEILKLQEERYQMEEETKNGEYALYVCISYGGRAEILAAVQKLAKEKTPKDIEALTEEEFGKYLWTAEGAEEMPEPDIIIRTGGEKRLSNFLTWQSVYSELFFTDTLWPEFSKEEFTGILEEYAKRERRRGK